MSGVGRIVARVLLASAAVVWLAMLGLIGWFLWPDGAHQVLDSRILGYGTDAVREWLGLLTDRSRAGLGWLRVADTVFPPLLAAALIALMRGNRGLARLLWVLPVAYAWLDWQENAAVAALIEAGADGVTEAAVAAASRLTVAKYAALAAAAVAALAAWRARR